MFGEVTLLAQGDAQVVLSRGAAGSSLQVVNDAGRIKVPLSLEQAETLSQAAPGASAHREIERRWLVFRRPENLDSLPHQRLRQGYILVSDEAAFRVREKGGGHKLTIKRGKGLDRAEVEVKVSDAQANLLWPLAGERIIDKTRYNLPDGDGVIEIDIYHGRHEGLMVAEREFSDAAEAHAFSAPSWMSTEVTEDGRYTNARLALEGLPQP